MSQSNNKLSMINLLIFLGISPAKAVVSCGTSDCCWVVRSLQQTGQSASFNPAYPKACCNSTSWIQGVTCTSDGKVTGIKWEGLRRDSSIPPAIGMLVNLQTLILASNGLTGSIPSSLGNLKNLEMLDFSDNYLTKIPASIGNLPKLKTLNLNDNYLSGSIPSEIGNLGNLTYLGFSGNQLNGSIPSTIKSLTNLKRLNLAGNQLTGSIPDVFETIAHLESLNLRRNQLTGKIPSQIGKLENLNFLDVSENQGLEGIFIPNCKMDHRKHIWFDSCPKLTVSKEACVCVPSQGNLCNNYNCEDDVCYPKVLG